VELRHLRYFAAVAEELHFGRAAQRLHIVQPALSKQIANLENELGVQLFHRTRRRVTITAAGRALYDEVRVILQRIERAVETAQMTATGQIGSLDLGFVGPAMWSVLPRLLESHHRRLPDVRFRLSELSSVAQIAGLRNGTLDAGFVRLPLHDYDDIEFTVLLREPFVVTLQESHPAAASRSVDLAQLAAEPFIFVPRRVEPGFYDRCIALCQSYGFSPNIVEEGTGPTAICGMVATGLGITLSPASILNAPWPGVVFRELSKLGLELELAVATRREEHSAALRAFFETIAEIAAAEETEPGAPDKVRTPRRRAASRAAP
jgi:DNA-binding transcriptional LysR family regulator